MEQADKSVSCGDLLHHFHGELVVVCCDVCGGVYRRKLVLRRCNLVVLCLGEDTELPQLFVEVLHVLRDSWLDCSEVVIIKLLTLWRLGSEESSSGKDEVFSLLIKLLGNEEVFLLGSHGSSHALDGVVSEELEYSERLLIERFHGAEQRGLLVKSLSAVGAERRGYAKRAVLYERIGRGIPCRVSSCLKRSS